MDWPVDRIGHFTLSSMWEGRILKQIMKKTLEYEA